MNGRPDSRFLKNLRLRYKAFRKTFLSYTPFVRRARHNKRIAQLELAYQKYLASQLQIGESLGYLFLDPAQQASAASLMAVMPIKKKEISELCLFVTHANTAGLKRHVADHVTSLTAAGVEVVLIINTDIKPELFDLPAELTEKLFGCLVRQNVGYDFGAWAHAYALIDRTQVRNRLYLVNDSIVGPLDDEAYQVLLKRIRSAPADLIGMTVNPDPHDHLQSYYLVVNERLLHSLEFNQFMGGVVNLPLKEHVIMSYEIWLTTFLEKRGYTTLSMFPKLSAQSSLRRNDTVFSWKQLIEVGFPFVKSVVIKLDQASEDLERLVPKKYRDDYC